MISYSSTICIKSLINLETHSFYAQQEMSSRQQKSARTGSERHLMLGPKHMLITLKWDRGRSPGHENICRWFLNRYKHLLGPSKQRIVFLGKFTKWNLNFKIGQKHCV